MQRIAVNISILESYCYVTTNLQFVTQIYSKCVSLGVLYMLQLDFYFRKLRS